MEKLNTWHSLWGEWINEVLASGLAYIGGQTQTKIRHWQKQAKDLGFVIDYNEVDVMLDTQLSLIDRTQAFNKLLMRNDTLTTLITTQRIQQNLDINDPEGAPK